MHPLVIILTQIIYMNEYKSLCQQQWISIHEGLIYKEKNEM